MTTNPDLPSQGSAELLGLGSAFGEQADDTTQDRPCCHGSIFLHIFLDEHQVKFHLFTRNQVTIFLQPTCAERPSGVSSDKIHDSGCQPSSCSCHHHTPLRRLLPVMFCLCHLVLMVVLIGLLLLLVLPPSITSQFVWPFLHNPGSDRLY